MDGGQVLHVGYDDLPATHRYTHAPDYPYWIVGCLISGQSRITGNGHSMVFPPCWLTITAPRTPYHLDFADDVGPWISSWMACQMSEDWQELLDLPHLPTGQRGIQLRGTAFEEQVVQTFREARDWQVKGYPGRDRFLTNALERILLLGQAAYHEDAAKRRDLRIETVRCYLAERLADAHSIPQLAALVSLSTARFAALFEREVGISPMRYLERLRMAHAQGLLLSTNKTVQAIAREVGFDNQYHFSTRFRHCVGQSPRHYRQHPQHGPLDLSSAPPTC